MPQDVSEDWMSWESGSVFKVVNAVVMKTWLLIPYGFLVPVRSPACWQHSQPLGFPVPPCSLTFCTPSRSPARKIGQRLPMTWKNAPMIPQPQVELPSKPPRGHEGSPPQVTMSLGPLLTLDWDWTTLVLEEEKERENKYKTSLVQAAGWEGRRSVSKAFLNLIICHFLIVLHNCVIIPKYFSLSNRTHNYMLIEMCNLIIRICKYIIVWR